MMVDVTVLFVGMGQAKTDNKNCNKVVARKNLSTRSADIFDFERSRYAAQNNGTFVYMKK